MPEAALRPTALSLILVMLAELLMPALLRAGEREFDTVLSGLPLLPEKANEPFPAGSTRFQQAVLLPAPFLQSL